MQRCRLLSRMMCSHHYTTHRLTLLQSVDNMQLIDVNYVHGVRRM